MTPQLPPRLDHQLTAESATELLCALAPFPCLNPSAAADGEKGARVDVEEDAHKKRFALLVFAFGGGGAQRKYCANPTFTAAVANCLEHPAGNVRALAIETIGALATFDESLALPHVPRVMSRLADADDGLAVLSILRADLFPKVGTRKRDKETGRVERGRAGGEKGIKP